MSRAAALSLGEVIALLQGADDAALFAAARQARGEVFGDQVYLRGIVEFSSICCKKCLYCGLRAPNADAVRYRLSRERILEAALLAPDLGLGTVVLQSGDDYAYTADDLCALVQEIKARTSLAVTLSVGDRPLAEFARFRESGADRYLIKLETLDQNLYARMRPGEDLGKRLERLEALRCLGFEVGSGVITGLPGMDAAMLAKDLLRMAALDLDMIALGPFVPHHRTPLARETPGDLQLALRANALMRLLSPGSNIPATSALNSACPSKDPEHGRALGMRAGCNVVMPSLTPESVRRAYDIYPGKNAFAANARQAVAAAKIMIRSQGLEPSPARGDAPGKGAAMAPREETCSKRRAASG